MKLKNIWNNVAAVAKDKRSTLIAVGGSGAVLAAGAIVAATAGTALVPIFAAAGAYALATKISFGVLDVAAKKKKGPKAL